MLINSSSALSSSPSASSTTISSSSSPHKQQFLGNNSKKLNSNTSNSIQQFNTNTNTATSTTITNNPNISIGSGVMTSYSASYTNLKQSSNNNINLNYNHNNNANAASSSSTLSTISRQSSTLTFSNNYLSNGINNNNHSTKSGASAASLGKIAHNQTILPSSNNTPPSGSSGQSISISASVDTPNNSNYSQNNPKALFTNSVDYNSPLVTNKVVISKNGNFQTTSAQPVYNNNSNTTNNPNINSLHVMNRVSRSTSNGNESNLPHTRSLRGLAVSTSSLSTMESSNSSSRNLLQQKSKLPPLSLNRLEKSTSDSSLEHLSSHNDHVEATPRVVNIDKYFKFASLVMDEEACDVFLEFLRRKRNEENLEFILQVSALRQIPSLNHGSAIEILQRIRSDFLTLGSLYELNVSKSVKSLSIDRIDRCLQQQQISISSSSVSSLNGYAASPVLSLPSLSSPSTLSLTFSNAHSEETSSPSYDSPCLVSSLSSNSFHSSPRDFSESNITGSVEIQNQPITTSTILKEIELEVRLQLQNESFKEFKASDEFEHFLLTKVIEQSQNNNPVSNSQSPLNSPTLSDSSSVNSSSSSSRSDQKSLNSSVVTGNSTQQTASFFSKIFKKKSASSTPTSQQQQLDPKSDDSTTDDELSAGSGDSDYSYNPQNPNDVSFVENLQMRKWNNPQVINFFKFKLELPEYTDSLKKNDIKGSDLSLLKKEDTPDVAADKIDTTELQKKVDIFLKKIKMVKLGHKKKLQREVNEAIIAYQKRQHKSNKISSLENRTRKVSDSILPKPQLSMEADLTTIIIKLWILPLDQKRVFTVKRCIKLDRLRSIILKEIGDLIDKRYPSENPNQVINTLPIQTPKGDSLTTSEKLYQFLCTESTNSQLVTLKIEMQ